MILRPDRFGIVRLAVRLAFYPTLVWHLVQQRWRRQPHWNWVNEHLLLGARPRAKHYQALRHLGVTGVVNMCEEFPGDPGTLDEHHIEQLWLPTLDFSPPSLADVEQAIAFIDRHRDRGGKVYCHCKAGRGRSATVALCYLLAHEPLTIPAAHAELRRRRPLVAGAIARTAVVRRFAQQRGQATVN